MKLQPVDVETIDLLHTVAATPAGEPVTALADRIGRDESNLRKTLKRMREAGSLGEGLLLTERGHALTQALSAEGDLMAGAGAEFLCPHERIRPDPLNYRQTIDPADLEERRVSLIQQGLLQPLLVRADPEHPGDWLIVFGEIRWRAIGLAIADDDWRHDGGQVRVRARDDLSDLDVDVVRLTENVQRADPNPLDEGERLAELMDRHGLGEQEIADLLGKSRKHVQDRVRVARALPADLRARMRLPKDDPARLTWREARGAIQDHKVKPAVDVTPAEALVLLELARHIGRNPSRHPMFPAIRGWARLHGAPSGGGGLTLARNGLIEIADGPTPGDHYGRLATSPALDDWIAERGGGDEETWDAACHHAACDALDGIAATMLLESKRNATAWLNAPIPESPPAQPAAAPTDAPPHSPHPGDAASPPPPPAGITPPAAAEADQASGPTPVAADSATALAPDFRAGAPVTDHAPTAPAQPPAPATPPPEAAFPTLSERQLLMLLDIADQTEGHPEAGPADAYVGARAYRYFDDAEANDMVQKGLIRFNPDAKRTGYLVVMTDLGKAVRHGPAMHVPRPPGLKAFWLEPPAETPAPAGRPIGGPLGSMLNDEFAQQMREAREGDEEVEPGSPKSDETWSATVGPITVALVQTGTVPQNPLRFTLYNALTGRDLTARLTRDEIGRLWAELGFAMARLDGAA